MKCLLFGLAAACLFACNSNGSITVLSNGTDSTTEIGSSKFSDQSPKKSRLPIYKQDNDSTAQTNLPWDAHWLDGLKKHSRDTATLLAADSTFKAAKPDRRHLGAVRSKLHAWVPMTSKGSDKKWALVWYTEYADGTNKIDDSTEYQEYWLLNNKGKAKLADQFLRKSPRVEK